VVKHIAAVELRVVVAAVLAVAADAMIVAQHLLKLGTHLVTYLARLYVHNLARRSSLEAGSTRVKKGEERKKLRVAVDIPDGRVRRAATRAQRRSRRARGRRTPRVVRTCRPRPRGKTH
jgi:hypothetical protein